jgi:hypothetical protein
MSRLEEVVGIYEEAEQIIDRAINENDNKINIELHKALSLVSIAQSLKNIDITLAILLDEKGGANESS